MTETQEELKCKLTKAENRIMELEHKICDYDKVKADKQCLETKMNQINAWVDWVSRKQGERMSELVLVTQEGVCRELESHKQLVCVSQKENVGLQNELANLKVKCQEEENVISVLKNAISDIKKEACRLTKKIADLVENGQRMCTETERADKSLQKAIAENSVERVETEKKIGEAEAQNTCLKSSITELEDKNENTIAKLQYQLTELWCQLGAKAEKETEAIKLLEERQRKFDAQTVEMDRLNKMMNDFQDVSSQEKCKADEEISNLKVQVEKSGDELMAINRQYCDAHAEVEKLKEQVDAQSKAIKRLELTVDQQRQVAKFAVQSAKLAAQKYAIEREELTDLLNQDDKQIRWMMQELCKLKRVVQEGSRQVKSLKMQLADFKCSAIQDACEQTDSFMSVLMKYAEELKDEDESSCATSDSGYCAATETDSNRDFDYTAYTMKAQLEEFNETFNEINTLIKTKFD